MIRLEHLSKMYSSGKGVDDINLYVPAGSTFGFLGPNGAGKTTTIRLLLGLLRPDQGGAWIKNLDCWQQRTEVKRHIGYLPGELHFFENLSGDEFLELMCQMHGNRHEFKVNRDKLAACLDLNPNQPIRKMSKGMKQKLGIISVLMLDAEVLILDEPTSGLDPLMKQVFLELIREEKKKGKTIFMSSHDFKEIERTCEKVGIIREGQLLAVEDIQQLKQMQCHIFEIAVTETEDALFLEQCGLEVIQKHNNDIGTNQDEDSNYKRYLIRVSGQLDSLWPVLSKVNVEEFRQHFLELEEAFIQYYEEKGGDRPESCSFSCNA